MHTRNIFILLVIIISTVWGNTALAQETCSIRYTYDKAGHRTKRAYKCETPPGPGTPSPWLNPGGVISSVYPVPTSGVFHVEFSTAVSSAYLVITDINGSQLMDRTISQQTNIVTFDISPYAAGTYILTGIFGSTMESLPVTKL